MADSSLSSSALPQAAAEQAGITFNANELWLAPFRLEGLFDENRPEILVNLVWDLHGAVGSMVVMRAGIASEHDGRALIEAAGALHQYTRLITHGEYEADALQLPRLNDPYESARSLDGRPRATLELGPHWTTPARTPGRLASSCSGC